MKKSVMSAVGSSEMSGASRWLAAFAADGPLPLASAAATASSRARAARPASATFRLSRAAACMAVSFLPPGSLRSIRMAGRFGSTEGPPTRGGPSVPLASVRRLLVGEAAVRHAHVREVGESRVGVAVDAVAERDLVSLEEAGDRLLLDVDDVVVQPAPVREPGVVAGEDAHPVLDLRRRNREVDPQLVGERVAGERHLRDPGAEDGDEVVAAALGRADL